MKKDIFKNISLFSGLDSEELTKLEQISTQKSYLKNEFLFMEGDEPKKLFVLTKGAMKIYKSTPKGKEIFLHTIRPVSLVAELVNFENIPYPASGMFLTNSEILQVDYEKFQKDFLSNPKICFELLKSMAGKLKLMSSVLQNELTLKSDAKVAKFIVENSELFSSIKHIQIASILNITPETLSRILAGFRAEGLVKFDDNLNITYKDSQKLTALFMI